MFQRYAPEMPDEHHQRLISFPNIAETNADSVFIDDEELCSCFKLFGHRRRIFIKWCIAERYWGLSLDIVQVYSCAKESPRAEAKHLFLSGNEMPLAEA